MTASTGLTDSDDRVDALEGQVRALREEVAELRRAVAGEGSATAAPREAADAPSPSPMAARRSQGADLPGSEASRRPAEAAPPPRRPARAAWRDIDFESLIGGRWLNRIGILTLLIAAAFFLRYAFENEWIGPMGRVLIGLVSGLALAGYGEWLAARGMRYFAEGMTALGAGIVYLSGYAAWDFYALVPQPAAFAFLALVTAAVIGLSVRRDSQRLAALALAGGYLTPALLSTGADAQVVLFSYLALLSASLLALALLRGFRVLAPAALVATAVYFIAWYVEFYAGERLLSTALFGTLLYVIYFALPVARARMARLAASSSDAWTSSLRAGRPRRLHPTEIGVLVLSLGLYVVLLQQLLYEDRRWWLTGAVLALAAVHLAVSRALGRWSAGVERRSRQLRVLFAVLGALLATIAFPIRLEGDWITLAWTAEAVALAVAGTRLPSIWMRAFSVALFGVVLLMTPAAFGGEREVLFVNLRFLTLAAVAASLVVAGLYARRRLKTPVRMEAPVWTAALGIANLVALVAVSAEMWDVVQGLDVDLDLDLAAQVVLSAVWLLWAAALIAAGIRGHAPGLRWQGLALLLVVVGKTFLIDLSFLEQGYRILSFLIVGVLLVAVSFLYQRSQRGGENSEAS